MRKPSLELIAEINALQKMNIKEMLKRYEKLVPDLKTCTRCEIIRAEIAYRLQERFYGLSLSEATRKRLDVGGSLTAGKKGLPLSGTRLVREWKGETHEVVVREDGVIEYREGLYKSLSAVARKITGTNWNGRLFFGIKK